MGTRSLSANQLAALSALIATPATKANASITLSGNLLKVIDSLAGAAQRSAGIEQAVQSYAARQLKERRRERELALLNKHADALNAEGDDSASYSKSSCPRLAPQRDLPCPSAPTRQSKTIALFRCGEPPGSVGFKGGSRAKADVRGRRRCALEAAGLSAVN
jgi:hypothetical protein